MFFSHSYSFFQLDGPFAKIVVTVSLVINSLSVSEVQEDFWLIHATGLLLLDLCLQLSVSSLQLPKLPLLQKWQSNLSIRLPASNKAPSLCTDLTAASEQQ